MAEILNGRVESYAGGSTMEFSVAALGVDRRFTGEVASRSYSVGDRIVVGRTGNVRSSGWVVLGNLSRGATEYDLLSDPAFIGLSGDFLQHVADQDVHDIAVNSRFLGVEGNVSALQTTTTGHGTRLSAAEGSITTLGNDLNAAETALGNLSSSFSTHVDAYNSFVSATNASLGQKLNSSAYTASDVLSKLLTVDGAGSALDADLLDGQHGAYYATASALGATNTNLGTTNSNLSTLADRVTRLDVGTGWVNINYLLNGGTTAWGGSVQIIRQGDAVHVTGYLTVNSGSVFIGLQRNTTAPITIPVGYRPVYRLYDHAVGSVWVNGIGGAHLIYATATNRLQAQGLPTGTWAAGNSFAFATTWWTNETYP